MWLTDKIQPLIAPDDTILDLGCGGQTVTEPLICKRLEGVDAVFDFRHLIRAGNAFYCLDLSKREVLDSFASKSYDVVLALDFIEHLTKEQGYDLIDMMERVARKKVIIFTPQGFLKQDDGEDWAKGHPDYLSHKSGWNLSDFLTMGYTIETIPDNGHINILATRSLL